MIAPTSSSLQLVDPGSSKATELLLKAAAFMKIDSLEEELFVGNARRSQPQQENIGEPPSKRLRMNGVLHDRGPAPEEKAECSLEEELVSFSCHFGIPSVFTHLYPSSPKVESTEQVILPDSIPIQRQQQQQQLQQELSHSSSLISTEVSPRHSQRRRKRPRGSVVSSFVSSVTSLARGTVSTLGSVVKTAVSITTLGLVNLDENREDAIEVGERIEDQIYHEEKLSRIHWDKHHQLIFPSSYYLSHPSNQGDITNGDKGETSARPSKDHLRPNGRAMAGPVHVSVSSTSPSETGNRSVPCNFDFSPLMEDASIAAAPPTSYYPIVLLQHFSGGWTLTQPLCHATGIPMHVIHSLPLCGASLSSTPSTNNLRPDSPQALAHDGHFWATVVALTCLKELFHDSRDEWRLVAHKGEVWLEEREKDFPVSLQQAWEIARGLVVRPSNSS